MTVSYGCSVVPHGCGHARDRSMFSNASCAQLCKVLPWGLVGAGKACCWLRHHLAPPLLCAAVLLRDLPDIDLRLFHCKQGWWSVKCDPARTCSHREFGAVKLPQHSYWQRMGELPGSQTTAAQWPWEAAPGTYINPHTAHNPTAQFKLLHHHHHHLPQGSSWGVVRVLWAWCWVLWRWGWACAALRSMPPSAAPAASHECPLISS